ncbi:hypothetical protein EYF80_014305 [Liparis tanakae]|uniref:Uncharacterized protein n=1 Tax=Liparis tanakae TaxID=230148 RepID=A0A4Z2IEL1_9TELE|nr:hypothetical protein EYF80_014305 [Liparis tanakae]
MLQTLQQFTVLAVASEDTLASVSLPSRINIHGSAGMIDSPLIGELWIFVPSSQILKGFNQLPLKGIKTRLSRQHGDLGPGLLNELLQVDLSQLLLVSCNADDESLQERTCGAVIVTVYRPPSRIFFIRSRRVQQSSERLHCSQNESRFKVLTQAPQQRGSHYKPGKATRAGAGATEQ